MITDFGKFCKEGIEIHFEKPLTIPLKQKEIDAIDELAFKNSITKGFFWMNKGKRIEIIATSPCYIKAYPSVDLNYIIAIYSNSSVFEEPMNAVVYNADGSIRKILDFPGFISNAVSKRMTYLTKNYASPLFYPNKEARLQFRDVGCCRKSLLRQNNLSPCDEFVNWIDISFQDGNCDFTGETRIFNAETCEFEDCLDWNLARYARLF